MQLNSNIASLQNDVDYLQTNINYQISQVKISLNHGQDVLDVKINTEVNTLNNRITNLSVNTNTAVEEIQSNLDEKEEFLKTLIDENLEKINSSLERIIILEDSTNQIIPIAEDLRNQVIIAKDLTETANTYAQQARNDAINANLAIGNSTLLAEQSKLAAQLAENTTNNYKLEAKSYRDQCEALANEVFGINSGARYSNTHAGTIKDLSLDDDYLYICVQSGEAGNAK